MSDDKLIRGIDLINSLREALGITHPVRKITLTVDCQDLVKIDVESVLRNKQGERLAYLLKENYCLCKNSEDVTPLPVEQFLACRSAGTPQSGSTT